jgi:predicted nuclease with TOPRIM domain
MDELPRTLAEEVSADVAAGPSEMEPQPPQANGTALANRSDMVQTDLQRLAGQSVEVLSLYGQITGLVQQHLAQLSETAERLRQELDLETERVTSLRAERSALQDELSTLRGERDNLRRDLETMVETGLARRRELAAQIEELERAREATPQAPSIRRPWWQFW